MVISSKSDPYDIPKYSLTGDLLAFLECATQYRFNSKGSLPPSTPVQLWFGEFIHGVMEEAFLRWKNEDFDVNHFDFEDVQVISVSVAERLEAKGLHSYPGLFLKKDTPKRKCRDCLANKRAFQALSFWGKYLFPLIEGNEVKLEDIRPMKDYDPLYDRSDYYSITGVADVITSVKLNEIKLDNQLMQFLVADDKVKGYINRGEDFEIIIDYKGMERPHINDPDSKTWEYHEWQLNTYMFLRKAQLMSEGKKTQVVAGILMYMNELEPSEEFKKKFPEIIRNGWSDVIPDSYNLKRINNLENTDEVFKRKRCIRIIPYDQYNIDLSLLNFDNVVKMIESNVFKETEDSSDVMKHWVGTYKEERCTACDMKPFCKYAKEGRFTINVP